MRTSLFLFLAASLVGCATGGSGKPPAGGLVYTHRQGGAAGNANIYYFETPSGTVLVDVPLRNSDAKKLRNSIVRPYRIYISAAKPERFASLEVMKEGDVPAFTTPAVATEIQNYGDARLAPHHKSLGEDVPSHVAPPSPAVEERTHDLIGETVEIELLPLGPSEAEASLALYLPKSGELITGDVVGGKVHLDLTWGRSVVWQDRINEMKALQPKHVYPGHGQPGGPEVLDDAMAYLKFFHEVVATRVKSGAPAKISPGDLTAIKQQVVAKYPKYGREDLLDRSIAGEYAVQLAALPPAPAAPEAAAQGGAAATTPAPAAAATPAAATSTPAPAKTETVKSTGSPADELLGSDSGKKSKKSKKKK